MKKKCFIAVLLCICCFGASLAQTSTKGSVVPPSPEAFSLGRVDFSEANLYAGRANYSVPLYTIREGSFGYPIVLNYTGGNGIRVGEIASSVGLGWNLSYTGAVSRTIRGLADDIHKGNYLGYIYLPDFPNPALGGGLDTYRKYSENIYDGQPDLYSLNVGGMSVSFYLDRNKRPVYVEKTDVKVVPVFTGYTITGFEATNVDGVRYIFDEQEESRSFSYGGLPQPTPTTM